MYYSENIANTTTVFLDLSSTYLYCRMKEIATLTITPPLVCFFFLCGLLSLSKPIFVYNKKYIYFKTMIYGGNTAFSI